MTTFISVYDVCRERSIRINVAAITSYAEESVTWSGGTTHTVIKFDDGREKAHTKLLPEEVDQLILLASGRVSSFADTHCASDDEQDSDDASASS
jgi:hypothetical protein